ncbi:MAG TPA: alpha/beta fold hydrolase [Streptosporangiaceae bacterium]|nr:alpha/beta fold hydrolase [Streptosporangiaceae bacterium]
MHLFGSSWGGMLAMQYTLDRRPDLRSLVLCGSPASMIRWVSDCDELLPAQPPEVLAVIRQHESPWPAGFERSFAEAGYDVYNTMNGPSEFTVTGTLKTWDIMDRLGEISVPALLVGGRYDECTPGHMAEMHRRIPGSQLATIEAASHLCFAEQPEIFNTLINRFLADRD